MCKYIYVCVQARICVCLCMYITVYNMCSGRLSCTEATGLSSRAYVRAFVRVCVGVFVCGCEYVCLCMYITVYNMSTGRFSCTEATGRSSSVNN